MQKEIFQKIQTSHLDKPSVASWHHIGYVKLDSLTKTTP